MVVFSIIIIIIFPASSHAIIDLAFQMYLLFPLLHFNILCYCVLLHTVPLPDSPYPPVLPHSCFLSLVSSSGCPHWHVLLFPRKLGQVVRASLVHVACSGKNFLLFYMCLYFFVSFLSLVLLLFIISSSFPFFLIGFQTFLCSLTLHSIQSPQLPLTLRQRVPQNLLV